MHSGAAKSSQQTGSVVAKDQYSGNKVRPELRRSEGRFSSSAVRQKARDSRSRLSGTGTLGVMITEAEYEQDLVRGELRREKQKLVVGNL